MDLLRGITCDVLTRPSNVLTCGRIVIEISTNFNQLTHLNRLSVNGGSIVCDLLLLQGGTRWQGFWLVGELETYSDKFYGETSE